MPGYTKLFHSILDSTVWQEPCPTRVIWITLLAMADMHGEVEASVPGLAKRAGVTIPETQAALTCFLSPDAYSRTKEQDGRRIEEIDGGWRIINHTKYRLKMSLEDIRERNRIRQQRHREKEKQACHAQSVTERDSRDMSRESLHTEEQAQANAEVGKNPSSEVTSTPDGVSNSPAPSVDSGKKPRPKPLLQSPAAERLATLLQDEIRRNKPDYRITPAQLRNWAVTADRMMRLDGRTEEKVEQLIRWVQKDEFWMMNVLSMDTLRKKFDQLEMKQRASSNGNGKRSAQSPGSIPVSPVEIETASQKHDRLLQQSGRAN